MRVRLRAEFDWARERSTNWLRKRFWPRFRGLPTTTPDLFTEVTVRTDQPVPMRDGIRLSADVYLPAGSPGRLPVVLIRMPYGKQDAYCYMPAHGRFWAHKGYACVIQDVRGRFASEGEWVPYHDEADDGWDTLDWVADQPWCDGNVGMTGESYYGSTQWAVAPLGHPNLKCLAPGDVDPDFFSAVHDGSALCFATAAVWAWEMRTGGNRNHYRFDPCHLPLATTDVAAGAASARYRDLIDHPTRDAFWDAENAPLLYDRVNVPMMHWGGWYDVHVNGTLAGWRRVREQSNGQTRADQWFVMGATDHELAPEFTGLVGRTQIRNQGYAHDRVRRFMDCYLRGTDDEFLNSPRVQYHTTGGNAWHGTSDWPPEKAEELNYYLHSRGWAAVSATDGSLDRREPGKEEADSFVYNPPDSVTHWLGRNIWEAAASMGDRRPVEARSDVLVYTGDELDEDLEVAGPVSLHLFAASSALDTDFTAALVDVFPDGFAQLVREGIIRARYRASERDSSLLEPGEVYEYSIDLASTSYLFPQGHKMRIEISSSNFDRYDRNLNTGGEYGREASWLPAQQRVFHDRHRSTVLRIWVASKRT